MRDKSFTLAVTSIIMLGGCVSYQETLQQKLEGKSPAEKRVVLAQECGSEISKGLRKNDPDNAKHFAKMKAICEEMTGQVVSVK